MAGISSNINIKNEPIGLWVVRLDRMFAVGNSDSTTEVLQAKRGLGMGILFSSHITFEDADPMTELFPRQSSFELPVRLSWRWNGHGNFGDVVITPNLMSRRSQ